MRWFTVLAMAFLVSCAPDGELADTADHLPPFRFNITGLPTSLQESVTIAAGEWNAKAGKALIVIDPKGPHRAILAPVSGNGVESAARSEGWVWTIRFEPGQENGPESCRLSFARHAFGHVLESEWDNPADPFHSPDAADVMYPGVGCNKAITPADLASIAY